MVPRTGVLLTCWFVTDPSAIGVVLARAEGVRAFAKEFIQRRFGKFGKMVINEKSTLFT
jgi:hypothetical protein